MPDQIEIIHGGEELLDRIEPLWERLRDHHRARAGRFAAWFARHTFARRRDELRRKSLGGALLVEIARDPATGRDVGYCVSSLDAEGQGEIESIFVEEAYRRRGLGDGFLHRALTWLAEKGARDVKIVVACGNEEALGFYARYGFYPRTYVLRQPVDADDRSP
ncbi:MAG: GNAT family N-acetyltransferase [Firmicutes bacterium]|nr:GNAT family N-acetyltransferase [Bacillota bacterium]